MTEQYLKSIFTKAVEKKSESHKTKTTITVLAYGKKVYLEERLFKAKKKEDSYYQKEDKMHYFIGVKEIDLEYPLSEKEYNELCKLFDKTYRKAKSL